MKVIYIRDSGSRGYLRIGLSDGKQKAVYTVSEAEYREVGSPLVGDEISDLSELSEYDMRYRAKLSALRMLSFSDSNARTLRRKLIGKSVSPDVASEIYEEMVSLGYINERRQLERLISNEANLKLSGTRKIIHKLVAKGYSREDVESVLSELVLRGELDFASLKKKLIEKKFPCGASEDEIRALLYKSGYSDSDSYGDSY